MKTVSDHSAKNGMSLFAFFNRRDILVLPDDLGRDDALRLLIEHLHGAESIARCGDHLAAIIARENIESTVVGDGVALPHARLDDIDRPYVGIATSGAGIDFGNAEGRVHLMMMALIPASQPGLYLQILHALAAVLSDKQAAAKLSVMQSADEIMRFFERDGLALPDYVCAADIMHKNLITLRDNDSLQTAIDCFISKELNEIPVVDKDGDMIGVVSAGTLLHVCLPEYLTWMNDLSPIINFEPFTNVLRNEKQTWLADILREDYPSVQINEPAISVAATLLKQNAANCYVLDGKKLKGAITLPNFLNKIFRE
jgi:nitrogen PTS system EIIA component